MSARGTQHGTRSPTVFCTHAGPRAKVRDQVSFARAHAAFHVHGTHAHAVLDIATTPSRAATVEIYASRPRGTLNDNARRDCPRGSTTSESEPDPPSRLARIHVLIPFAHTHTLGDRIRTGGPNGLAKAIDPLSVCTRFPYRYVPLFLHVNSSFPASGVVFRFRSPVVNWRCRASCSQRPWTASSDSQFRHPWFSVADAATERRLAIRGSRG